MSSERLPSSLEDAVEELQCPVYMQAMFPPIFQCPNGYTLCCECNERVRRNRCLTYREKLHTIRYPFPCRFKSLGCEHILPYQTKLEHESNLCKYRSYTCHFFSKHHCSVTGDIPQLFSHLKDNHKVDVYDGCTFKLNYRQLHRPRLTIVINRFGKQFCLHFESFTNNASKKLLIVTLQFMGKIEEAIQFGYTLEIKGSSRKLSSERLSGSIRHNAEIDFTRGGDGLVIPSNSTLFILEGEHSLEIEGHIWDM